MSFSSPANNDEIYQEHILDHYEDPFHRGGLSKATHSHEEKNPLCGDIIEIKLVIDSEGSITDLYFTGDGCVISQASASMLLEELAGKNIREVQKFTAKQLLALYGPRLTPGRQKCCLLSWRVLQQAIHSPIVK